MSVIFDTTKKIVFCFGVLMVLFFSFEQATYAQEKSTLPTLDAMSAEQFASQSEQVSKAFENDEYVSVGFSIQSSWKETPFEKLKNVDRRGRLYGTLVEYVGPVAGYLTPSFRVIAEEMDREMSLPNWFQDYAFDLGYHIEGFDVDEATGNFEAFYIERRGMDTYYVRVVGTKIGPRVIMAKYSIPSNAYRAFKDYQIWTIKSVKFKGFDSKTVESREYFAYLDSLSFDYPVSWRSLPEKILGPNKMSVTILNVKDDGVPKGNISVYVLSARAVDSLDDFTVYDVDIKQDLNAMKQSFAKNYIIHPLIEKKTFKMRPEVKYNSTDIYPLEPITSEYVHFEKGEVTKELWFGLVVHSYKYYVVTMITPSRDNDVYNWAINGEAFKIVMESLVREKDNKDVEFVNEFENINNLKK